MKNMKKLTALVSAFTLTICAVPMASSAESKEYILTDGTVVHSGDEFLSYRNAYLNDESSDLGDVNRDGYITDVDANMIMEYYMKLSTDKYDYYTEEEHEIFRKYGDVFNDGFVDVIDASWVFAKASENTEENDIINVGISADGPMSEYTENFAYSDSVNADLSQPAEIGDVNHDGFVDARDASMVSVYYALLSTDGYDMYTEEQHENFHTYGDLNNDGYVDARDAVWISIKYTELSTLQ